ncbi:MAG TPA: methyltransferase domain-containing protein [Alphaproteobacteria bacterium]|jgi:SAM-dependent methyltransferase
MTGPVAPFDRRAVRLHRDRAARDFAAHDFLFREAAERLAGRLDDLRRRFRLALDLGCHAGGLGAALAARDGIEGVVQCDLSPAMAAAARAANGLATCAADEEALPFADAAFDLAVSNLSLHWVNDLPGALVQIRRVLAPDGLLLASLFGAGTLAELRAAMTEAELAVEGGASPRVAPFADLRDLGDLLARAGFALPVADLDTVRVSYETPLRLMRDLAGMGEANAVAERRRGPTRRATLVRSWAQYPRGADGRIEATFEVMWIAAWAPGPGQQKALSPGSARARLATALGTEERPAGDTVPRPGSPRRN